MDVYATDLDASSPDASSRDAGELDASQLAADLSQAVTRLRRALQRAARANFDGESLSPTEVELLLLVAERPGIGVAVAASELGAAPNTVSTLIRKLVALGLLHREFSRGDRRVARLLLTEDAEARIERWRGQRADVLTDSFGQLNEAQLATLHEALPVMEALSAALYQPRRRTKAVRASSGAGTADASDMSDAADADASDHADTPPTHNPVDLQPAWRPDAANS